MGFFVGAEEALVDTEPAKIVGAGVNVLTVACWPDARTGRVVHVRRDGTTFEAALADLTFAAFRRCQGGVRDGHVMGRVPGNVAILLQAEGPDFADL